MTRLREFRRAAGGRAAERQRTGTVGVGRPETRTNRATSGRDDNDNNDEIAAKKFRIMYLSVPWTQVLPSIANKAGLILVMHAARRNLSASRFREMTFAEALQIINKELDDTNFRLVRQGQFLVVLYTPDLRTEYERPVVRSHRNHEPTQRRHVRAAAAGPANELWRAASRARDRGVARAGGRHAPLNPWPAISAAGNDRSHAADSGRACVLRSGGRAGPRPTEAPGARRRAGHAHETDPVRAAARHGDASLRSFTEPSKAARNCCNGTERSAELPRVGSCRIPQAGPATRGGGESADLVHHRPRHRTQSPRD